MQRTRRAVLIVSFCLFASQLCGQEALPIISGKEANGWAVGIVQSLLSQRLDKDQPKIDGLWGPQTKAAVIRFQNSHNLAPGGVVDATTWHRLFGDERRYVTRFIHGKPGKVNDYESKVEIWSVTRAGGKKIGDFRGSIMPDDMKVKGRIVDGVYEINLGLHKRNDGAAKATQSDLVVKTNGFVRPCLVVQRDGFVPVRSDNPSKTRSNYIHVHNGFRTKRYSEGCQTIHPDDWSGFIGHFLRAHPKLDEWYRETPRSYIGRSVGVLVVESLP
jgi:hypothetical protein